MIIAGICSILFLASALADVDAAAAAVRKAALGYVAAAYEGKPELIEQNVDPQVAKLGLMRREGSEPRDVGMSFDKLRSFCERPYKQDKGLREVEVFGVLDHIACAKLTADWGIDYFHLVKDGERWKIRHVLWQSHPGVRGEAVAEADLAAIKQAANDYIDAFYKAEPERIDRAVAADLVKFGFYRPAGSARAQPMPMDFQQLRKLAAHLHMDAPPPADAPHEVEILDALDHIALVKVVAAWGIDYMQVAKREGTWKIQHVIWQSHPPKA